MVLGMNAKRELIDAYDVLPDVYFKVLDAVWDSMTDAQWSEYNEGFDFVGWITHGSLRQRKP